MDEAEANIPFSKTDAIRAYLATHSDAKNAEVVAALETQGIEVTTNYVSIIKSKGKKPAKRASAGKTPGFRETLVAKRKALLAQVEAIDTLLS